MNQKKRQHALIVGAGLCLLIVMIQLFGGSDEQNLAQASALPEETTMTDIQDEQVSPATASTTRSGFYQSVRQKLQAFIPEQSDSFFIQSEMPNPKSEIENISNPNTNLLPPLPVDPGFEIRNPEFERQNANTGRQDEGKTKGREDARTERREEGVEGSEMSAPPAPEPEIRNPKLKGFVRQAETGMAIALIEWESRLLQVSTEPGSEWQIVSYNEESIIVRHGEKQWELRRE